MTPNRGGFTCVMIGKTIFARYSIGEIAQATAKLPNAWMTASAARDDNMGGIAVTALRTVHETGNGPGGNGMPASERRSI